MRCDLLAPGVSTTLGVKSCAVRILPARPYIRRADYWKNAGVRLVVVLFAMLLLTPAAARAAGETSIFYYPWWGTPQKDGKYLHWNKADRLPPAGPRQHVLPDARRVLESRLERAVTAHVRDRAGGRRRGDQLVVGPGLTRSRSAADGHAGRLEARARRRGASRAVREVAADALHRRGRLRVPAGGSASAACMSTTRSTA